MPRKLPPPTAVETAPSLDELAPEAEHILNAAVALFADLGIRRTTIGDIAKRAGVDRVTVYRRVGSKDDVVQAVVVRDSGRMFDLVARAAREPAELADRIAVAFATMIEGVRDNAIFSRLVDLEPETVLPRLTTNGQPLIAAAVAVTMQIFEQAIEDGLLAESAELLTVAETLVRVVHSFLLTPATLVPLRTHDELLAFGRRYLAPMVRGGAIS